MDAPVDGTLAIAGEGGGQLVVEQPTVRPKRKQGRKDGQTQCWFPGCYRCDNLAKHPADRTADVQLQLRIVHDLSADEPYRSSHCLLCPVHLPFISPTRVLGARVAIPLDGILISGEVVDLGRGGLMVSNPAIPLLVAKPWRIDWDGITPAGAPAFMSSEEVALR